MDFIFSEKWNIFIAFIMGVCVCVLLILSMTATLYAQIEAFNISSPPNPVGSGARAMGIAGAFVAVADDATAASWNPAGLVQLQTPEVSMVYSLEKRKEKRYLASSENSMVIVGELGREEITISDLNYLSMAYPFNFLMRNMVFSLNYQRLYDFNRELHFVVQSEIFEHKCEFESKGTLYTLSPAFAIQATEDLFFGATLNIWSDEFTGRSRWENLLYNKTSGQKVREKYENFRGLNANIGFLYRIIPRLTLGGVFKIPFRGKFDYTFRNNFNLDPNAPNMGFYGKIVSIDFPPTYALGLSYRFSDAWSISSDVTRKDWNEFAWYNSKGKSFGLFTDPSTLKSPKIDPTYSFRFGIEYLKILEKSVIPIRGGLFYDPIPSIGSPHSEYGFSLGSGLSLGDLIVDFAYQYRIRHDVPGKETVWGVPYIYEDKTQHIFLFSTIYHF